MLILKWKCSCFKQCLSYSYLKHATHTCSIVITVLILKRMLLLVLVIALILLTVLFKYSTAVATLWCYCSALRMSWPGLPAACPAQAGKLQMQKMTNINIFSTPTETKQIYNSESLRYPDKVQKWLFLGKPFVMVFKIFHDHQDAANTWVINTKNKNKQIAIVVCKTWLAPPNLVL